MLFLNNWRDEECEQNRLATGPTDFDRDLADRVYTSQLIGKIPDLVMHGGGNTSCKTVTQNLLENLMYCCQGSGGILGQSKPLVARLKLEPL